MSEKGASRMGTVSAWVAVGLSAYFLSPPFAIGALKAASRISLGSPVVTAVAVFYGPAEWVYDHCPPYKALMDWEFRALGVK